MAFELPALPYDKNALEPYISAETLGNRYARHHQAHVERLNELLEGTDAAELTLEEIVMTASGITFEHAAQVWSHTFYWHCLSPYGDGKPKGALGDAIDTRFGSFDKFKACFTASATAAPEAGWTWLIKTGEGTIEIVNTRHADTPIAHGQTPILVVDVGETTETLDNVWHIVNWDFADQNYATHPF